ncbi:hypothetical protein RHMOL_Rhmol06G0071500 [Rhododendron molle]|uniref:Uncharacterized protein n=1 Tax=Rhododendron molle TaxID=49168 RepID=A0ACC0NAA8_RHOML|nr:hypothetical protein RHMOL_Rhmol06G0071500 [Rhododendron molle]
MSDLPSPPASGGNILQVDVEASTVAMAFSWKKMWQFTGPGLLMTVGFLDPGNIQGDLQAGAIGEYSLLWLMMWATAVGLLIQLLSARLGVATGRNLAKLCEEYPYWAGLLLWVMTEVALIGADMQEAVGIVGCVITPYNVFLHSASVQSRNINPKEIGRVKEALNYYSIESSVALLVSFAINLFVTPVFAVGFYGSKRASSVGLANAGEYVQEKYGGGLFPIYYIWGIGLLVAGQSSTITGTLNFFGTLNIAKIFCSFDIY